MKMRLETSPVAVELSVTPVIPLISFKAVI